MTWPFWIVGLGLLGIAAVAVWRFFSDPVKVAGLIEFFASKAFKAAMAEILRPETPEAQEARQKAARHNDLVPTKLRKHPNEGGHR